MNIKKIKENKHIGLIYSKVFKSSIHNSLISSILRIFFRFKTFFKFYMLYFKSYEIKEDLDFWIIRIGFTKKRNFTFFLNLDFYLSNHPNICSDLKHLPLKNNSCQKIQIKHFFDYFLISKFNKILKAWNKKLISGGILEIQLKLINNEKKFEKLKKQIINNYFFIKNIDNFSLKINGTIKIIAIKEKPENIFPNYILDEKINDILLILKQCKDIFQNKDNILVLGFHLKKVKNYLKSINKNASNIQTFNNISETLTIQNNYFDCGIIANSIEFQNYSEYESIFNELRRILKPSVPILILVPEKKNYFSNEILQLIDKGIILKILDEFNFTIKWINLSSSFKLIQILILNQFENPIKKKKEKICLLGNYALRYTHLNSSWWDGQVRGFEKLGYKTLVLDVKDNSFSYLMKSIKIYKPDILWIAGKVVIDFLKNFVEFFRSSKIKVVYWFWDVRTPKIINFKDVIDYMFVSSIGEIDLYKKSYNLDNVYFMPALITPHILHRNRHIKEKYDIGFSGLLDNSKYHQKRTEIIKFLRKYFEVKVINNLFNNLPEFYSQCKIVFGGTPDLKHLELYSSNRLYISLSCGCCYLTNYFKGLEKIAGNEEHILWYNTKDELLEIVKKYLNDDEKRNKIKENAESLAELKHNYTSRIINMIEIVERKTDDFKGYIN
jgi:hypothetical protein